MNDLHDFLIDLIRTELVLALPFMALLTVYAFRLAKRQPSFRSPRLLFWACFLAGADATWLAGASWYRDNIGALPDWALVINAAVTSLNAHLPFLVVAYFALRWLRD